MFVTEFYNLHSFDFTACISVLECAHNVICTRSMCVVWFLRISWAVLLVRALDLPLYWNMTESTTTGSCSSLGHWYEGAPERNASLNTPHCELPWGTFTSHRFISLLWVFITQHAVSMKGPLKDWLTQKCPYIISNPHDCLSPVEQTFILPF